MDISKHNEHVDDSSLPSLQSTADGHRICSDCGRVIYSDPKVAVAAIIPLDDGIVLLKRAIQPNIGKWSFPSGYVNRGEKLELALEREVLEECGLIVSADRLLGVYSHTGSPVLLVVYEAKVQGGKLIAGDETSDAGIFPISSLPQMAFSHDGDIIKDWLARGSES